MPLLYLSNGAHVADFYRPYRSSNHCRASAIASGVIFVKIMYPSRHGSRDGPPPLIGRGIPPGGYSGEGGTWGPARRQGVFDPIEPSRLAQLVAGRVRTMGNVPV